MRNGTVRRAPKRMPSPRARIQARAEISRVVRTPWSSQWPDWPLQSTLQLKVYFTRSLLPLVLDELPDRGRHGIGDLALGPEPLVVELEVLAGADEPLEPGIDGGLEVGLALAHGHAVGLVGEEVTDDLQISGTGSLGLQPRQLDPVVAVRVDLPLHEGLEGRGLIREFPELGGRDLLADDLGVGRPLLGSHALARDVLDAVDGAALLHQQLGPGAEERDAEIHGLPALRGIGHGPRDQVDGVGAQERDAGGR